MNIDIYQDGACWNKPSHIEHMGIGVAVFIDGQYEPDYSRAVYEFRPNGSNNIAEWLACVLALKTALDFRKIEPNAVISVYSDSQIIVNQFNGLYQIRDEKFRPYYNQAIELNKKAKIKVLEWVPREQNKHADKLSKIGLKLYTDAAENNHHDNDQPEKSKEVSRRQRSDTNQEIKQITQRNKVENSFLPEYSTIKNNTHSN